ncbi:MAG: ThuA domain-containing protein [Acidobacteria bacterium]|nr:ThuA domain-containing protein [Acidobacteriota bacterium]
MKRRTFLLAAPFASAAPKKPTEVLVVIGPSNHPPGTHEVAAGGRLVAHCLEHMNSLSGFRATVLEHWPQDAALLNRINTIVFIGDVFPPVCLPDTPRIMADLDRMMQRGCGIACIHFATGLQAKDVPPSGDHPLLRWMGGYFSTGGATHHKSVAKVFSAVTITPASPKHPISRGWKQFTQDEEPYYNNYFGPDNNRMASNVTALATAMLPPESPKLEVVSWCVQRPDRGRGFAVVMPHFYRNWKNEDFRRFVLNGIVWSAGREVPRRGVETNAPDMAAFTPESLEPIPRKR